MKHDKDLDDIAVRISYGLKEILQENKAMVIKRRTCGYHAYGTGKEVFTLTSNLVSIALPWGPKRRILRCNRHRMEDIIPKAEDLRGVLLGHVKRENEGRALQKLRLRLVRRESFKKRKSQYW